MEDGPGLVLTVLYQTLLFLIKSHNLTINISTHQQNQSSRTPIILFLVDLSFSQW